jgi:hypothetical protein
MMSMTIKNDENSTMLLPSFIEKFGILFSDDEFAFKADRKLIALILASLRLEDVYSTDESICPDAIILRGIYFIHEGKVDVYYKQNTMKFLVHE